MYSADRGQLLKCMLMRGLATRLGILTYPDSMVIRNEAYYSEGLGKGMRVNEGLATEIKLGS